MTVELRPAVPADIPLLDEWDREPHVVAATYDDPSAADADDFGAAEDLAYAEQLGPDVWQLLIAEVAGRPIGAVRIIDPAREPTNYWGDDVEHGLRALDIWIGERDDLGKGYGTEMMRQAIDRCFADPSVTALLIDPLTSNTDAHRFYQRLGFRIVDERDFDDDHCYVMRLDRPSPDAPREWWRHAVIYQIYPRSFADSDGDGVGDLRGITTRLDQVAELGVDAVWLSPFQRSPQRDAGYDVSDYRDVDPRFGTLDDFDAMVARAHDLGLRVIVDIVPNHSSDEHPWFQAALAAGPGSPARERYVFRDGRGEHGELPPNNWESVFGGSAWERVTEPDGTPGQWYLHLFDVSQPDFDWSHPEVHEEFRDVLRFWLQRGVDGFRVDVAHGLVKHPDLPDWRRPERGSDAGSPYWGQPGVHEIFRDWRTIVDAFPGERALCGEVWMPTVRDTAQWVRPGEMHQTFNFQFLQAPWRPDAIRDVIDESLAEYGAVGAPSTWVLSNHDVIRHATRLALGRGHRQGHGIGPDTPDLPDPELGRRRARAATALMLALPGSAYLYQGEELGLPEVIDLPDHARQDPTWERSGHTRYGRDGCRVPIPWEADAPAYGFNTSGASWLPQPSEWGTFARDVQAGDPQSTLNLYRTLLAARRRHALGTGTFEWLDRFGDDVLAFRNGQVTVIANFGFRPVDLPEGEVVVASVEIRDRSLPPDAAAWLAG